MANGDVDTYAWTLFDQAKFYAGKEEREIRHMLVYIIMMKN